MSQYSPKQYEVVKVELDLSNYATKTDLKLATGVDTSNSATKFDLVNLKTEADIEDIDKLETFPSDLSKLSNVADKDVFEKTVYNNWLPKSMQLILMDLS